MKRLSPHRQQVLVHISSSVVRNWNLLRKGLFLRADEKMFCCLQCQLHFHTFFFAQTRVLQGIEGHVISPLTALMFHLIKRAGPLYFVVFFFRFLYHSAASQWCPVCIKIRTFKFWLKYVCFRIKMPFSQALLKTFSHVTWYRFVHEDVAAYKPV